VFGGSDLRQSDPVVFVFFWSRRTGRG
jgi:hypothetical protein